EANETYSSPHRRRQGGAAGGGLHFERPLAEFPKPLKQGVGGAIGFRAKLMSARSHQTLSQSDALFPGVLSTCETQTDKPCARRFGGRGINDKLGGSGDHPCAASAWPKNILWLILFLPLRFAAYIKLSAVPIAASTDSGTRSKDARPNVKVTGSLQRASSARSSLSTFFIAAGARLSSPSTRRMMNSSPPTRATTSVCRVIL